MFNDFEGTKTTRAQFGTRLVDFDVFGGEPDLISDIEDVGLGLASLINFLHTQFV